VRFGGLRAEMRGWAAVYQGDGIPSLCITELKLGAAGLPEYLRSLLEDQPHRQLALAEDDLPSLVEELELEQRRLTVCGRIRPIRVES